MNITSWRTSTTKSKEKEKLIKKGLKWCDSWRLRQDNPNRKITKKQTKKPKQKTNEKPAVGNWHGRRQVMREDDVSVGGWSWNGCPRRHRPVCVCFYASCRFGTRLLCCSPGFSSVWRNGTRLFLRFDFPCEAAPKPFAIFFVPAMSPAPRSTSKYSLYWRLFIFLSSTWLDSNEISINFAKLCKSSTRFEMISFTKFLWFV